MEIHRQQCQNCGWYDMRNILVREEGRPTTIYVRCHHCKMFVARYVLSDYYHHGKGLDSYLRAHRSEVAESGREMLARFDQVRNEAVADYERTLARLEELGKAIDPEGSGPLPEKQQGESRDA